MAALAARGVPALGVDLSAVAQRLCRRRRTPMVRRDVFGPLPGEGTWGHVLLADGNIGIGGDPLRLLRRADAAAPAGRERAGGDRRRARRCCGAAPSGCAPPPGTGAPLPWACAGADALGRLGATLGLRRTARYRGGAQLRRAHGVRAGVRAGRRSGRVSSKRQPGPEFTTESRPPCASVRARAMASPSPAPESVPGVRAAAPR